MTNKIKSIPRKVVAMKEEYFYGTIQELKRELTPQEVDSIAKILTPKGVEHLTNHFLKFGAIKELKPIEKEKEVEKLHNEYRTMLTEQGSDFKKTIAELNGELKMVTVVRRLVVEALHLLIVNTANLIFTLRQREKECELSKKLISEADDTIQKQNIVRQQKEVELASLRSELEDAQAVMELKEIEKNKLRSENEGLKKELKGKNNGIV